MSTPTAEATALAATIAAALDTRSSGNARAAATGIATAIRTAATITTTRVVITRATVLGDRSGSAGRFAAGSRAAVVAESSSRVEKLVSRQPHKLEIAGSTPAPAI